MANQFIQTQLQFHVAEATLLGDLTVPKNPKGIVLFAHGSGSSRHSSRNQHVANVLQNYGIATLLFDLLTKKEEAIDQMTGQLRFDIPLLANRLKFATDWIRNNEATKELKIGYFGASTGGGAALMAAAELGNQISAVVSRGGRPDLAAPNLAKVTAATLLIVGGLDHHVIELNRWALDQLHCEKKFEIVLAASHLFEEPGKLDEVARLACEWFLKKMGGVPSSHPHHEPQFRHPRESGDPVL